MDVGSNLSTGVVVLTLIVVQLLNWWHTRVIAKLLALTVEAAAKTQTYKLDQIYKVADGRLSEALQTIEDLKALLVEGLDAQSPRIKQAIAKNS
jgi:hypothetical protein